MQNKYFYEIWRIDNQIALAFIKVYPQYRRKGLGKMIVKGAIKLAKKEKKTLIIWPDYDMTPQNQLDLFYKSCGLNKHFEGYFYKHIK